MALRVDKSKPLNALEVICENDDAIDSEESDYQEYLKTGDVKHLVFVENKQPTRFIVNFELSGKESALIKNEMVGGRDEDNKPKVTLGSWAYRVTKYTLKDVQNPPDLKPDERIELKKDDKGYVSERTMSLLDRYGVTEAIFGMYSNLVLSGAKQNAKNS